MGLGAGLLLTRDAGSTGGFAASRRYLVGGGGVRLLRIVEGVTD